METSTSDSSDGPETDHRKLLQQILLQVASETPLHLEIWLSVVVLFCCIAIIALRELLYQQRRAQGTALGRNASRMRTFVVVGLFVSSSSRALSIAVDQVVLQCRGKDVSALLQWERALDFCLPSFFFLSTFSLMVLFWAQLYYTTTMVRMPLLNYLFLYANVTCYLLVLVILICTLLLGAYSNLRVYSVGIVGVLDISVAFAFAYYSLSLVFHLKARSNNKRDQRQLVPRVVALAATCPIALLVRGVCYVCWSMAIINVSIRLDLLLCVLSEFFPAVVILITLLKRAAIPNSPNGNTLPLSVSASEESTDSESPLLRNEVQPPGIGSLIKDDGRLGWKQIYPQQPNDENAART